MKTKKNATKKVNRSKVSDLFISCSWEGWKYTNRDKIGVVYLSLISLSVYLLRPLKA